MSAPDLKVVGEIRPPEYKDPVQMLRNLADDIEAGEFGDIETVVVATSGEDGVDTFGGGRVSSMAECAFLFAAAAARFHRVPWGDE